MGGGGGGGGAGQRHLNNVKKTAKSVKRDILYQRVPLSLPKTNTYLPTVFVITSGPTHVFKNNAKTYEVISKMK